MRIFHSMGHLFGGTLLIAGTMIGVGMLALPVVTGEGGFFPGVAMYILCWLFMLCTGLLLLEVCSWMPKDSNLITMAERLLGPIGKNVCWIVYLFLFLTVMIAHVVGGGAILSEISNGRVPEWIGMIAYVVIFSPIVYFGTKWVDRLNMTLVSGVLISYFLFVGASYEYVDLSLLKRSNWGRAWIALPVLFTSFTFQVIIPTLMTYMNRNVKRVRLSIILGTTIPLLAYLVWEFLILGIIPPEGSNGLIAAAQKGWNAVTPLKQFIENPLIPRIGKAFAFFTMTASYVALSLAYLDFLADGLRIKKKGVKKILLCIAIFVPPTLVALTYPHVFIMALSYAGGFSCAILFGLFPPLMVWVGRYVKRYDRNPQLPGGKVFLSFLMLFALLELGVELVQELI